MSRAIKHVLDIVFAAAALVILSPVLFIAAIAIRVSMGRPVLFRHTRAGFCGQPFVMLKFRSMTDEKDESGCLLSDVDRLTRLGRLLRKTSIDELPQLWNVLKGEMSFVGPRPLPLEYIPRYTPDQCRRQNVLPGIVGLPAVEGRAKNPWEKRLEMDTYYVDNWSLFLDIKIVLRAIPAVFHFEAVNEEGQATCCKFCGTDKAKDS
jgi:lipopolysaccharide/colanic/teichoic acid biosynthesis glycosyltransferase